MSDLLYVAPGSDCLAAHPFFRCTGDADETCKQVSSVFRPHQLRVMGRHDRLDVSMDHVRLGRFSISRLRYGEQIQVTSEPMESFMMVLMPNRGQARIVTGRQTVECSARQPAIVSPDAQLDMVWSDDCEQMIFRIERSSIEAACAAHLGGELKRPLSFDAAMNLESEALQGWQSFVSFLLSNTQFFNLAQIHPLVATQAEQLLVSVLLASQHHNYSDEFARPHRSIAPHCVRRAEEYMETNAHNPLCVEDIALHVGVSVRSLFSAFQKYRGTSPMAHLKGVRLDKVRAELAMAGEGGGQANVTTVAMSWGFSHLGHFTRAYQMRFGELPSRTLRGG